MRNIFILIFIFFIAQSNFVFGQNEYEYALEIQNYKEQIRTSGFTQFKNLKTFVNAPLNNNINSEVIKKEFEEFKAQEKRNKENYKIGEDTKSTITNPIFGSLLSQDQFIIAFTDVMIERAKEELAIAYFDRATERMKEEKININFRCAHRNQSTISTVFPNFYFIAKNSRTNFNVNIGSTLISAFQNDLNGMYSRIDENIIPDCYKRKDIYSIQNASCEFYNNLKAGISLEKSLIYLRPSKKELPDFNLADHYLNLLSACSNSLMGKNRQAWIDIELNELKLDKSGKKIYLGLLYNNKNYKPSIQKLGFQGENKESEAYLDFFLKLIDRYFAIRTKLSSTDSKTESVDFYNTRDDNQASSKSNGFNNTLDIANELIYILKDFTELPNFSGEEIKKGTEISLQVINFYRGIHNENYGSAALAILIILNNFSDYNSPNDNVINPELVKYITLAADISQAQNSHAAKLILENAILPTGSYKLKRSAKFSTSINAYIGLNGGFEFLDQPSELGFRSGYIGPFLPVGVDFSISNGSDEKIGASTSIFISAFDFGTVAGYRFKTDVYDNNDQYEIERYPKLKFQHFISPGIFLIRGCKKSPISWGVGGQYTPRLRNIKGIYGNDLEFSATSFRLTAFLAVDIPLLNVAVKGQKNKTK